MFKLWMCSVIWHHGLTCPPWRGRYWGKKHWENNMPPIQKLPPIVHQVHSFSAWKAISLSFSFPSPKHARGRDLARDLKSTRGADFLCLLLRGCRVGGFKYMIFVADCGGWSCWHIQTASCWFLWIVHDRSGHLQWLALRDFVLGSPWII